jgi:FemAB-related protein (PEP-CTERM system-associated)
MSLRVERLDDGGEGGEGGWDAFVDAHPEATLFHRAGWRRVVRRTYRHPCPYLVARDGDDVRGVLPLVEVASPLFGRALISTGFFVYGGILAADDAARTALADAAMRLGADRRADFVELRSERPELAGWATKRDVYATFRRTIEADEAACLKAIPRKKRADVRKSLQADLATEVGVAPALFHRIYAESVRNLGTPVFPLRFVEAIRHEFRDRVELSLVRRGDTPLAALLSLYDRDTVLPYYGGAVPAARPVHAYDHLYWSLMRRAAAEGVRRFDFGRSKVGTGAYDYKRFWGFEPTPLHYQYHLVRAADVPDVNPLNPKYRLLVRTWQRLPLAVANRLGPLLARQLG